MLPVTVKEIASEMSPLYQMHKARNIKSDNDDADDEVMLADMDKHFKGTFNICRKKEIALKNQEG